MTATLETAVATDQNILELRFRKGWFGRQKMAILGDIAAINERIASRIDAAKLGSERASRELAAAEAEREFASTILSEIVDTLDSIDQAKLALANHD